MLFTHKLKTKDYLASCICGLILLYAQNSLAEQRWQIVVLPDTNYHSPSVLASHENLHSIISQGLTIALSSADLDVLDLHYLGLPNCSIQDCSSLTDQQIKQAAFDSGKEANLALLYQLNAFEQRQGTANKWYVSLAGRLLDLDSGVQQDGFVVDSWLNQPAKTCIGDCLSMWLKQNLVLLSQDLGMVLSQKLKAIPRRYHYLLTLDNFANTDIQRIDSYLKTIDGYIADRLMEEGQPLTQSQYKTRTYYYTSELTASELSKHLTMLNQLDASVIEVDYDNSNRQFTLRTTEPTPAWQDFNALLSGIFSPSENDLVIQEPTETNSEIVKPIESSAPETEENKAAQKDQMMWQQALAINTLESYQQYLNTWPDGQFTIRANAAIKAMLDDEEMWQQATIQNTRQSYQQYLRLNPAGAYTEQAKQQLLWISEQQQIAFKKQQNQALAEDFYYQQQNYPEALYYYQQAAQLGQAESQYQLAKMFQDGLGTNKNMRQAAHWYKQAAEQGHTQSQATLGFMYSKGNGVIQDDAQAVYWYTKAAEQGHATAQYNLAYRYSLGQGVVKNYQQAAFWYAKAAMQGDADAQASLGKLYERGLGVNKDLAQAKDLYQQAAAQGNHIAEISLQMLKNLN